MKKILLSALIVVLCIAAAVCWYILFNREKAPEQLLKDKKVLVVYYSYSGNTRAIAQKIQKLTNADIFEIKTVKPYPAEYQAVVEQAAKEKQADFRPEIQANAENIAQYDVIFLGTPVWWYTMAPPVKTFMSKNNFDGKVIMPFCTHGGGGAAATFGDMQTLAPKAKVMSGIEIYEKGNLNTTSELIKWIEKTME